LRVALDRARIVDLAHRGARCDADRSAARPIDRAAGRDRDALPGLIQIALRVHGAGDRRRPRTDRRCCLPCHREHRARHGKLNDGRLGLAVALHVLCCRNIGVATRAPDNPITTIH
jgi:hypothetical protein